MASHPGKKIAEGREAEVFEWYSSDGGSDGGFDGGFNGGFNGEKVLKLFFSEAMSGVRNELETTRMMKAAGASVMVTCTRPTS